MKKMLTTLMVLAIALTAVSATAGDVDWKFYGKVHASINYLSNGENSQLGLTSNTSRFGFKGSAAMNDEFTFVWQFEQKLNLAQTGNEVLSNRNSYVGFKNAKLGEVRMGIHDSPHKTLGRKTTFFFDTIGDNRTVTFGTDTRETDILAWVSPNWSGFGLFLAYQFDKDGTKLDPAAAADAEFYSKTLFSGMATYTADNFLVGASMIMFGEGYNATDGADRGDSPMVLRFAGKYNAEKFGVAGQFLTVGSQSWDGTDYVDNTAQTIGGEVIFHANEKYDVKGGFYMADPNTDADDDEYNLMTIGIDRNFSKSLQMYVQYAMLSNGDAGNGTLGGIGSGPNGFGKKVSGWQNEDGGYENPMGFSWGMAYKW
jgi:predicted porin